MDLSNLQSRVPPHPRSLHHHLLPKPSSSTYHRDKRLIVAASLLAIPFLFYLLSTAFGLFRSPRFVRHQPKPNLFGIVIDAASSGSRVHVYEFLNDGAVIGLDGTGSSSLKVEPGLHRFADDPEAAGRSVSKLVQFAKSRVPRSEWRNTKVQLMCTTEVERLELRSREAILESCRRVLRSSGFLFKDQWAAIMEGEEEALYAWVAANYALGTLGGEPQETTGIVKLGGASMQVAISPRDPRVIQLSRMIKLAGVKYNIYVKSMPYFGQDAMWDSLSELHKSKDLLSSFSSTESIVRNPCIRGAYESASNESDAKLLRSYTVGNFSACKSEVAALLKKRPDKCLHEPCEITSSNLLELQGKPVPPDKFYFISEFFGLVPRASLSELEVAGHHYCEDDWNKLKNQYHNVDDLNLSRYCFSSAYVVVLLHDSFGIPMTDKRIGFANDTNADPAPDWTLGAFILEAMQDPLEVATENLGEIVGSDAVAYFSFFAVLLIAVLGSFFLLRCQKPQVKTIYDLEKGHYIVTRVPR
ncbi:probable apyrase 6 isoform X1 [Diospyros lotus]|uniref:probable apyrase 6 isoform X1 n=1 Tax=Diospyros lotus TaxID=55363 RepID=UPI0022596237|nr:probable apyrase 6 isoform X1 [Diospyros lotus]